MRKEIESPDEICENCICLEKCEKLFLEKKIIIKENGNCNVKNVNYKKTGKIWKN